MRDGYIVPCGDLGLTKHGMIQALRGDGRWRQLCSLAVSRRDGTLNPQLAVAGERRLCESHDAGQSRLRADRGIIPGVVSTLAIDPDDPRGRLRRHGVHDIYEATSGAERARARA